MGRAEIDRGAARRHLLSSDLDDRALYISAPRTCNPALALATLTPGFSRPMMLSIVAGSSSEGI
jgi:hypothetical protein